MSTALVESPDISRRWSLPGIPHRGWTLLDVEDLGTPEGECQMCGQQEVRYIHHVSHPEFDDPLEVGCDCCERMTEDYVRPRARERAVRNRSARRSKWLTRQWRVSAAGNQFLNVQGRNIVVFPWGSQWKFRIMGDLSPQAYPTRDAAKLVAFDRLNAPRQSGTFDADPTIVYP